MHDIFLILQVEEVTGSLSLSLDSLGVSGAGSVQDGEVTGSLSLSLDSLGVSAAASVEGSVSPVGVIRGGGPAFPIRPPRRRKKRLDDVLDGLEPVAAQVKKNAGKPQIHVAAERAVLRAKAQHRLDEFAYQVDRIIAQRRDYDREVVLAAIAAQRVMRMEEEEAAALILLAA